MDPAWIVAIVAAATAAIGVLLWMGRGMWRTFRRTDQFLEDWNGTKQSPGHPRQHGVMERLADLEAGQSVLIEKAHAGELRLDHQDLVLETIRSEVTLDHGQSMKDAVQLILTKFPTAP